MTITVLLVEDDPASAKLTISAFNQVRQDVEVIVQTTGLKAVRYLEQSSSPDLIITDIKMQELDGNRLINLVKSSAIYKSIPVVVLSLSENPADIRRAYLAGCSGYFIKPLDLEDLVKVVRVIWDYWVTSKLPEI